MYIALNQDIAQKFWKQKLENVERGNDLNPFLSVATNLNEVRSVKKPRVLSNKLPIKKYKNLKIFAQNLGVTVNTIVQFSWHYLIHVFTKDDYTIVGTTFSGRALPIHNIESSVGLYVNTLPLILNWDNKNTIQEQLRVISKYIQDANEYSYANLAGLQSGERLFHSLLVFENYLMADEKSELNPVLEDIEMKVDYPISIMAYEEDSLSINFEYDGSLLDSDKAKRLLKYIINIIQQIHKKSHQPSNSLQFLELHQ